MRNRHWSEEEIRKFSTEKIFQKLFDFGIETNPEEFIRETKNHYSACALARNWGKSSILTAQGFDLDFPWMAAIVLWERLVPDVLSNEQLDDLMQRGYKFFQKDNASACDIWLEIWSILKTRFKPEMKSVLEAESVFDGLQCLYNWCQELEMALGNAAQTNSSYHQKRITYCQEFCQLFPDTDTLIIENMMRAQGEAYFCLGMTEEGEKVFQDIVKKNPKSAWGYIGWGDMYWLYEHQEGIPVDYAKAETIYRKALQNQVDEPGEVRERLKSLREKKGVRGFGSPQSKTKKKAKRKK